MVKGMVIRLTNPTCNCRPRTMKWKFKQGKFVVWCDKCKATDESSGVFFANLEYDFKDADVKEVEYDKDAWMNDPIDGV